VSRGREGDKVVVSRRDLDDGVGLQSLVARGLELCQGRSRLPVESKESLAGLDADVLSEPIRG
jgi:hypothetical protein